MQRLNAKPLNTRGFINSFLPNTLLQNPGFPLSWLSGRLHQPAIPRLANLRGRLVLSAPALHPRTSRHLWLGAKQEGPERPARTKTRRARAAGRIAELRFPQYSGKPGPPRCGPPPLRLARSLLGVVVRTARAGAAEGLLSAFVCLRARAAAVSEAAGRVRMPERGWAPPAGRGPWAPWGLE